MDGHGFDTLARAFTREGTRRGLFAHGGGLTLAGLLGGFALSGALGEDADARKRKKKKRKKKKKCKGSESCGAGQICVFGKCVTGEGTCEFGQNFCGVDPFAGTCNDNPNCHCYTKDGGATRCGTKASDCGACTTTEQCTGLGTGAVCVIPEGLGCECGVGQGFCITPCAT